MVNGPDQAIYGTSANGWMDGVNFTNWFKKIFVPHCEKLGNDPKLLLLDGHKSHITV